MTNEIGLLTESKKKILVNSREFEIGKLSLKQTLRFTDVLLRFCIGGAAKFKDINIDTSSNFLDALAIIQILPKDQTVEIIAVLLDTDDIEFCKEISAEDVSEIMLTICEQNDIGKIVKNFSRVFKIVKSQIKSQKLKESKN